MNIILHGDAKTELSKLADKSVNCLVTSPPYYGLRDYGVEGQIGLEETPEQYIQKLVEVFREAKRVLKDDGTLWVNIGDSYAGGSAKSGSEGEKQKTNKGGSWGDNDKLATMKNKLIGYKPKDLIGIPWMLAFALRADGWYLRQDIIWSKPNPMPESVTDRCTKSHEYIFLLSKSAKYYYDADAIQEVATGFDNRKDQIMKGSKKYSNGYAPTTTNTQSIALTGHKRWKFKNLNDKGLPTHTMHENRANGITDDIQPIRNKRSVWTVTTKPFKEAHFATFPEELIAPCILAGCPEDGIVCDPFGGAGTTALVARKLNRNYILIELNEKYIKIADKRIYTEIGLFA